MALAIRTTDEVEFVHISDPDTDATKRPADWQSDWLPASGQPAGASRFRVRALSRLDLDSVGADSDPAEIVTVYWRGLVSVDGEALAAEDASPGVRGAVVALVAEVSRGVLGPLGRC